MLSFQIINDGKGTELCLDEQGVETLVNAFDKLKKVGAHVHLCAPSNGGRRVR